jgi:hypothetical protein
MKTEVTDDPMMSEFRRRAEELDDARSKLRQHRDTAAVRSDDDAGPGHFLGDGSVSSAWLVRYYELKARADRIEQDMLDMLRGSA